MKAARAVETRIEASKGAENSIEVCGCVGDQVDMI
jgi:hypothetical protein